MFRRIADAILMPLGFSWLLGFAAIILLILVRKRTKGKGRTIAFILGFASVTLLYVSSIRPTSALLMWWVERAHPVRSPLEVEPVDAVFALGGGPAIVRRHDGELLLDPGPRFEAAMKLIEADRARILVLSGTGSKIPGDAQSESAHLRVEAIRRGVDPARIAETPPVATTGDEARVLAQLARERGWTRVAITTESWHMPRAVALFEREGLTIVPFSSGRSPPPPAQPRILDWLPTMDGLWRTTRAWHEVLGRLAS